MFQDVQGLLLLLGLVAGSPKLPSVSPQEAVLVQSFRHFDYFRGSIRFPRGRQGDRSNKTLRVSGWLGATHGIFRNCWGCYAGFCTSRKLCCGLRPSAACFDGLYFMQEMCCDTRLVAYDNHPEILTESLHQQLGLEQIYQRFTARRLEHLASLALPVWNRKVLELGARQGDLTHFFTDRGCFVTLVEPRQTNVIALRKKLALGYLFPDPGKVEVLSMDLEESMPQGTWDIVFCYGLLYHLQEPEKFLERVAPLVSDFLLMETVVSTEVVDILESVESDSMSLRGHARRLRREDVFMLLKRFFPYAYVPMTQPNHEQFETDWAHQSGNTRAIFIASRRPLSSPVMLMEELPAHQTRSS